MPGRAEPMAVAEAHPVLGTPLVGPWPEGHEVIYFAMGCFWGADRIMWQIPGVHSTSCGYMGGWTPNPTYEEVCSGRTGHTEIVLVVYDPAIVSLPQLLKVFFEEHDPTQGYRQGNDLGTQYRSAIYAEDDDTLQTAREIAQSYGQALLQAGRGQVTTEIAPAGPFFYAEDYHQQYLHKVPNGYCGLKGTGVACIAG